MSLGSDLARAARDAVVNSGAAVTITITRETLGEYDPVTGGPTPGSTQTQSPKVIVSPASGGTVQAFDNRFDGGTLIETNLRSIMVPAFGLVFAPGPGDAVTGLEGSDWTVLGSTPQSASGVPIYYSMTVRR